MRKRDEILADATDNDWVDGSLARVVPSVSNAQPAEMNLAAGFDEVLAQMWATDIATPRRCKRSRPVEHIP